MALLGTTSQLRLLALGVGAGVGRLAPQCLDTPLAVSGTAGEDLVLGLRRIAGGNGRGSA